MNASDLAAWVGAATGTTALLWDIVKWSRSGPRLKHRMFMQSENSGPDELCFVITNVGESPATIEEVTPTLVQRVGVRRHKAVPLPYGFTTCKRGESVRLPHALEPGASATFAFLIHDEPFMGRGEPLVPFEQLPDSELRMMVEVVESHREKPYYYDAEQLFPATPFMEQARKLKENCSNGL